jgi:outer membrane protein assembly factor BamD (BamD/ComL family)
MTTSRRLRCRRLFAVVIIALAWAMPRSTAIGQSRAGEQAGDPAATLFKDADATRTTGRTDDAIGKYQRVMAEYPASIWAARSALESARSMVGQGNWAPAMRQMEDV